MARKESSEKSKLIYEERPETETHHPRSSSKIFAQLGESVSGKCEGNGDCSGHAHHSDHSSNAKDEQVGSRPPRIVNRREHQERHGCRTGKSMNQTDDQRS